MNEHDLIKVDSDFFLEDDYYAVCSCGWKSLDAPTMAAARELHAEHVSAKTDPTNAAERSGNGRTKHQRPRAESGEIAMGTWEDKIKERNEMRHKARKILATHVILDEFVMAMGGWLFTKKDSEDHISTVFREHIPAYAQSFTSMMDEFDDMELKVTGDPIRFTATGPTVRDWGATDGLDGAGVAAKYLTTS